MIKGDDLLKEDTNHIIEKINENHDSKLVKLSYKTQLIITIVVGIIVAYCGFYTLYYVYLVPNTNKVGEVLNEETAIDLADELLLQVPYYLGEVQVYNDYGITYYEDLSDEFLVSYLLVTLETSEFMIITSCDSSKTCIEVTSQTIKSKYLSYYGESITELPENLTLSNEMVCVLENNTYSCSGDNVENYYGKISVVESIKEDEEYFYIYETALFVSNLEIDNNKMTFDYVALKPSVTSSIVQNGDYEVASNNLTDEIYSLYSSESYIYLHTFIKSGDDYYWTETQVVTSLP